MSEDETSGPEEREDNVTENIGELELQREFKDSYSELEAFEGGLRAEFKVPIRTRAEVHERLLKEEQWKDKTRPAENTNGRH